MARGDKTFQYVAKPRTSPEGESPRTPPTPKEEQPRKPRGGKVRVKEGDRCVPPARSRPKERQAIGPHEGDTVRWGEEILTVQQLMATQTFPLVIKVKDSGSAYSQLQPGQVLQIHSACVQQRVHVQDSRHQHLLLPKDFPLDLQLMGTNDRGWMKLADVLETRQLPIKARVMSLTHQAPLPWLEEQDLQILGTEDCPFLKANTIDDGWINQMEIILLPEILEAQFCIAEGMRTGDQIEWKGILDMYNRSVRHLNFSVVTNYPGVFLQQDEHYIPIHLEPDIECVVTPLSVETAHSKKLETPKKSPASITGSVNLGFEYEDMEIPASAPSLTPPPPPAHFRNASPKPQSPSEMARASTPFSDDEEDLEHMFDKVIKVGKETLERMRQETEQQSKNLFTTYVNMNLGADQSVEMQPLPKPTSPGPSDDKKLSENQAVDKVRRESSRSSKHDDLQKKERKNKVDKRSSGDDKSQRTSSTESGTPMGIIQPTFVGQVQGQGRSIQGMADVPASLETLTVDEVCTCLALLNMHVHIPEFRRHLIDGRLLVDMKEKILLSEFHFTPFNASKLARFVRGWRPNLN